MGEMGEESPFFARDFVAPLTADGVETYDHGQNVRRVLSRSPEMRPVLADLRLQLILGLLGRAKS
jgi:hypothetical protein